MTSDSSSCISILWGHRQEEGLSWCLLPQLPQAQHPGLCHGALQRVWAQLCFSSVSSYIAANHFWSMSVDVEIKHTGWMAVGSTPFGMLVRAQQPWGQVKKQAMAHHRLSSHYDNPSITLPTDPKPHCRLDPYKTDLGTQPRLPLSYTSTGKQGISLTCPSFYISNDLSFRYIHKWTWISQQRIKCNIKVRCKDRLLELVFKYGQ